METAIALLQLKVALVILITKTYLPFYFQPI